MSEEGKITHHFHEKHQQPPNEQPSKQQPPPQPPQAQYGTFQGVPTSPAIGFPQPAPPPGSRGYQAVPVYAADGIPVRAHHHHHRLPCCGIGFGWFFFIIGFFLAGIPWYAAAIIFLCCRNVDPREKPAYVCCTIAAVLAIIATIFGATRRYN